MLRFIDIQDKLDHILGTGPSPNHGSFWRGVTRDHFVNMSVYGKKLIVIGDPGASNLIKALRGIPPFGSDLVPRPTGAIMNRMPQGRPPASEEDIVAIEQWIRDGCPELVTTVTESGSILEAVNDDVHVRYWRAVDDFFLPSLATPEARQHVGRMHSSAAEIWLDFALNNAPLANWTNYLADANNKKSLEFVRFHQRRLLMEFYNGSQDDYFDSIWKFGANLLPVDPLSHARPEHTMNGIMDWFFWIAHIDATLRAPDIAELDLIIARAWQIGVVADGLLRLDDRDNRIPIGDFDANDPDLQQKVFQTFANANADTLKEKMISRAIEVAPVIFG